MGENDAAAKEHDLFLINEGFDLLAAFRAIKSETTRRSLIVLIASIAEAESSASERANVSVLGDESARFDH